MKARAAIAVVVLIVAVMATVSVARHRRAAQVSSMSAATSVTTANGRAGTTNSDSSGTSSEMPAPALPARPSTELIAGDSDAAARLWEARAEQVLLAKDRKEYGADVARLMRLNPDQAWRELAERAKAGDMQAVLAAGHIASLCMPVGADGAARRPWFLFRGHGTAESAAYPDLPPTWQSFVERLDAIQQDIRRERVSHCDGVGTPTDLGDTFIDLYLRPENLEAQVQIASENSNEADVIADLRKIAADSGQA